MPRVPIAENTVGFAQATDAKVVAPNMGAGGEAIGRALEGFGNAAQDAAATMAAIQASQDNGAAKEASNNTDSQISSVINTGQDAFLYKQGRAALDALPDAKASVEKIIADQRATLRTPRQQKMFDERVSQQKIGWLTQIEGHARKQAFQYDDDQSAASATNAQEQAVANLADPELSRKHIDVGRAEIAHRGLLNGWSPEQVAVADRKFTNTAHQEIATRLAYEGGENGPKLAVAYADQHRGEMTAEGYESALTHARVQQNALEADQRQAEAEARRVRREEMGDARARAQQAAANLDSNIPLEAEEYASAINDARTAGDEALERRLEAGQFKNGLTLQYQGAPPAEIQSRVSELTADIAKAGDKAKPEWAVERDHLQSLLSDSRSQLKTDPLAWGARRGIAVTKLNLNDPASIQTRVAQSTKIARETGTEPRPFTQDEVAASQQTLAHGTTQDKVGLIMRVARMGPLAMAGMEQLTNNAGILGMIGIATHSNHGVAVQRVNQIATGYDALKTKPKLIEQGPALANFNAYVGTSLHFFPITAQSVYSNAGALLANEANEKGWDTWAQGRDHWRAAINSALGAHVSNGVRLGGLATFNGAVTVLPENMSQAEFETRISKAGANDLKKGANGTPIYDGGRPATATDIKRMHWVPAGDGVYRMSDGDAFLKNEHGDLFEININKVHTLDADLASHGYVRR